jgi:hypothetical protein
VLPYVHLLMLLPSGSLSTLWYAIDNWIQLPKTDKPVMFKIIPHSTVLQDKLLCFLQPFPSNIIITCPLTVLMLPEHTPSFGRATQNFRQHAFFHARNFFKLHKYGANRSWQDLPLSRPLVISTFNFLRVPMGNSGCLVTLPKLNFWQPPHWVNNTVY